MRFFSVSQIEFCEESKQTAQTVWILQNKDNEAFETCFTFLLKIKKTIFVKKRYFKQFQGGTLLTLKVGSSGHPHKSKKELYL